ncbi:response regulator [Glaciihabitans sp. INWT7]|uniref:response regulator transcription factor n=1 Tax=Glaciihabitans sp. INWT7 TaxID=2596912 RepID=UPI001628D984|nr:response regulator [Glaciihabitans sp. INWT7]QNE46250.1 response regulator [Glaciihabitans sp. INWT7]
MSEPEPRAKSRVVIADDDPDIRALVSIAVTRAGLDLVAVTEDGDAAWEALTALRPDLAVLDVSMPGMTGLELCARVRADDSFADTRIVLLSAGVDDNAREAGRVAGATDFIAKPFSPRELGARLAELMRADVGDSEPAAGTA